MKNPVNTFIGQSLKHFIRTGAVFPSSKFLAKKMIRNARGSVVLELGPGTGVFTKEILNKLPANGTLISIEFNETFAKYLRENIKDHRLKLIVGDALLMKKFLKENGIDKVDYIISGLPLGHFSKELKNNILTEAKSCLKDDGKFIQFEYLLAGIRSVKNVFPRVDISFELLNAPPAFVMECKKI